MEARRKKFRLLILHVAVSAFAVAELIGCGSRNSSEKKSFGIVVDPPQITVQREPSDHTDEKRNVTFKLRNSTGRTVQIGEMTSSCSCTVAKLPPTTTLLPGGDVEIGVSVSVPVSGEQTATLTIQTDCPQSPVIVLPVVARGKSMQSPFLASQTKSVHVVVQSAADANAEIFIDTVEGSEEKEWLTCFTTSDPRFSVELLGVEILHPLAEGNFAKRYRARVSASASDSGENSVSGWLKFTSSGLNPVDLPQIPLFFQFVKALTFVPDTIVFNRLNADDERPTQKLVLISNGEEEWNCQPVDVPSFLTVTADDVDGDLPHFAKRFTITLVDSSEARPMNALLRFSTSLSSAQIVEVPLEIRHSEPVNPSGSVP